MKDVVPFTMDFSRERPFTDAEKETMRAWFVEVVRRTNIRIKQSSDNTCECAMRIEP